MVEQCTLFGLFGWIAQLILAGLCFLTLLCKYNSDKRLREDQPRPWLIFFLDISKQAFSAGLAHVINLMTAVLISRVQDDNPCVWYFITIFSDTTFGVLLCYLMLKSWESYAKSRSWTKLISGNYQSNVVEEVDLGAWAVQLMIWGIIVLFVRSIQVKVLILVMLMKASWLFSDLGHLILVGLDPYPRLELVVVMVIVPLLMNCMQFWVQDNFLKAKGSDWSPLKE